MTYRFTIIGYLDGLDDPEGAFNDAVIADARLTYLRDVMGIRAEFELYAHRFIDALETAIEDIESIGASVREIKIHT